MVAPRPMDINKQIERIRRDVMHLLDLRSTDRNGLRISFDPLNLAAAAAFPSSGQRSYGAWRYGHPVVGLRALSLCDIPCTLDPRVSAVACSLAELCGFTEPRTTTVEDMDERSEHFYCTSHPCGSDIDTNGDMEIFTWRGALRHAYMEHGKDEFQTTFALLSGIQNVALLSQLNEIVRLREAKRRDVHDIWYCKRCLPEVPSNHPGLPTSLFDVRMHCAVEHAMDVNYSVDDKNIFPSEPHRRFLDAPVKVALNEVQRYIQSLRYLPTLAQSIDGA